MSKNTNHTSDTAALWEVSHNLKLERECPPLCEINDEYPNPFLAVDDIQDNFDLVPPSKPNVWVLPAAILAVVVVVSVYAALFRWVL